MRFCHTATSHETVQLCAQAAANLKLTDLLRKVGCRTSTLAHYRQLTSPASFQANYRQQLASSRFGAMQNMGLWRVNVMSYLSRAKPKKVAAAIEAKREAGHYGAPIDHKLVAKKKIEALWQNAMESCGNDEVMAAAQVFRSLSQCTNLPTDHK